MPGRNRRMAELQVRTRVIVHGRVQGVFFRDSVRRRARAGGVSGWVSNRADGTVEAVFEGPRDAVARLVQFCREGPRGASVERVDVLDEAPQGLSGFAVR
jgi:acylphosphatase